MLSSWLMLPNSIDLKTFSMFSFLKTFFQEKKCAETERKVWPGVWPRSQCFLKAPCATEARWALCCRVSVHLGFPLVISNLLAKERRWAFENGSHDLSTEFFLIRTLRPETLNLRPQIILRDCSHLTLQWRSRIFKKINSRTGNYGCSADKRSTSSRWAC